MSSDTVYDPMQERMEPNHYHGDYVRMLFIAAAVLLFVTQFTGDDLPFTPGTSLIIVVALVVAAGITNPAQALGAVDERRHLRAGHPAVRRHRLGSPA